MDTRHFKVRGEISCLFAPEGIASTVHKTDINVELWHKGPLEAIFLGSSLTDSSGVFIIEFKVDSPVSYIENGKIKDCFIRASYKGKDLDVENPFNLLTDIVAYWKLDESSGTSAADATSNSHIASLGGVFPPTWTVGKINNGLNLSGGLSGGTTSFISIPTSSDFDFAAGDFTFAFWMKPNNTSGYYTLIDTGYPSTGAFLLQFTVPNNVVVNISGVSIYTKVFAITPGTWYHVVARRISGVFEVFINGVSLGSTSYSGEVSCPATLMYLGQYSGGGQNLDGLIDEIGIWKGRGLQDFEIERLYNSGTGLQYPF